VIGLLAGGRGVELGTSAEESRASARGMKPGGGPAHRSGQVHRIAMSPRLALALALLAAPPAALAETRFGVDPEAGNNTFSAVFDAAVGERITAVSSAVGCTFTVDEKRLEGRASCTVPLASIRVDNDDVKSDHFRQWATNKQVDPSQCAFRLEVPRIALAGPVEPMKPVDFETEGAFTVCGRPRDDRGPERIRGTILWLPADGMDPATTPRNVAPRNAGRHGKGPRTIRVRARIEGFDRERYRIGPRWTAGWLARVQQLAPVVATGGTIDVSLFAREAK
jgi:hypothetical protein